MVAEKTKEAKEEKTGHLSDMQRGKGDEAVIDIKEKRQLKWETKGGLKLKGLKKGERWKSRLLLKKTYNHSSKTNFVWIFINNHLMKISRVVK